MTATIHPPIKLAAVFDDSSLPPVTYYTEIFNGKIVVRTAQDGPSVWSADWPGRLPRNAPGIRPTAVPVINALLDKV
jgi:hypothetical protein